MKKLYLIIIFLAFSGLLALAEQEEIGFLLFLPNTSNRLVNEERSMIELDNLANYIMGRNLISGQIHIIGYAAVAVNDISSVDISRDRALFVINELQKRGVSGYLFSQPLAYGEVNLWGNNTAEEEMSPNRRARILLHENFPAPPAVVNITEEAARQEFLLDESGSRFPWKILLILFGFIVLAAIIFFLLKSRKSSSGIAESLAVPISPMAVNSSADGASHIEKTFKERSKFMNLEKAVRDIITGIPADAYFDVHTVIEKLLQEHDDVYLMNVGNYTSAAQYHSKISSIIAETEIVEKAGNSFSKNIHDKFSECHLFKRKK